MSIVYLNGDYMPMEEGAYAGKLVGFKPHLDRMQDGLDALQIDYRVDQEAWYTIAETLIQRNGGGNLGIYFHMSRGADSKRHHAYPPCSHLPLKSRRRRCPIKPQRPLTR